MQCDSNRPRLGSLTLSAVLMAAGLLTGCGGSDQSSARPDEGATQAEARIASELGGRADEAAPAPPEEAPPGFSPSAPSLLRQPSSQSTQNVPHQPQAPRLYGSAPAAPPPAAPEPVAAEPQMSTLELPAGGRREEGDAFATVSVFYATDRLAAPVPLSDYQLSGAGDVVILLGIAAAVSALLALLALLRSRPRRAVLFAVATCASGGLAGACVMVGQARIEKHGVAYTSERGQLVRGVCEVTVPDSHQHGQVERPSLLRFEIREDQDKHVVLTSAVELAETDFHERLGAMLEQSPERDLLVFIHGFNVDFESAVRRTAQLAVDLPFRGVPICYSWPSQGSLLSYTIDENNAAWTVSHLKRFLLELADESGADAINLLAHSMGNRALTSALSELYLEHREQAPVFESVVLAAPDVDADYFRRDLAPRLLQTSGRVTLYASSDDRALIASKQVHGYPRAGESGRDLVLVPGVETIDVSGIDLSVLGHSYYGDSGQILRDLFDLVDRRLPASERPWLRPQPLGPLVYYQLATSAATTARLPASR